MRVRVRDRVRPGAVTGTLTVTLAGSMLARRSPVSTIAAVLAPHAWKMISGIYRGDLGEIWGRCPGYVWEI